MARSRVTIACLACAGTLLSGGTHARAQDAVAQAPAPDVVVEASAPEGGGTVPGTDVIPLNVAQEGLRESLDAVPGVRINRTGGEAASMHLSVRGLQGRRVATWLGPVRMDDPATGTLDLGEIPAGALDHAVLTRGATGTSEGALGGALVLSPRVPAGPMLRAATTVGSEKLLMVDVAAGGPFERGRALGGALALARISSTDGVFAYEPVGGSVDSPVVLPVRTRVNNDRRRAGFTLLGTVEWVGGPAADVVLDAVHVEGGIAGMGTQPLRNAREQATRLAMGTHVVLQANAVRRVEVDVGGRMSAWRYRDQRAGAPVQGALLTTSWNGDVRGALRVLPWVEATAGIASTVDVARGLDLAGDYSAVRPMLAPHGGARFSVLDGAWVADVRVRGAGWLVNTAARTKPTALEPRMTTVPEARARWTPRHGVVLEAAVARAWRNPSLEELYRPADAPIGGDPDLLPEDGVEVNAATSYSQGWLRAGAGAYAARMFNMIAWVNVNAFDVRPRNVGDTWRAGGEAWMGVNTAWAAVRADVEVNASHVMATSAPLPSVPLLESTLRGEVGPPAARVFAEVRARSGARGNIHGELPIRPMVRADAGVDVAVGSAAWLRAVVRNVADDRTQTDTWGVPLPGREAFVTLVVDPGSAWAGGAGW